MMRVRHVEDSDRDWIKGFVRVRWGDECVVVHDTIQGTGIGGVPFQDEIEREVRIESASD